MKYKKSQSHIEVIISFILFMGAIFLIFYFLNPLGKTEDKNPAADRVIRTIMENITYEFGRLSVVGKGGNCQGHGADCCYYFTDISLYGNKYVEADIRTGTKKLDLYFSDIFPITINPNYKPGTHPGPGGTVVPDCPNTGPNSKFSFGEFQKETIIYYERLKEIATKGKDTSQYKVLKNELGINYDFAFNCSYLNTSNKDEISFTRRVPKGIESVAREFPIRTINSTGGIEEYIFNLRVW
jgi:hypothetical protein